MSDSPPDRKEADDAPAAPRNPWVGWLVWAILTPVLYVLSIGPAGWLLHNDYLPGWMFQIYDPLDYLPAVITKPINSYLEWWTL
jgi:hypothetical protein